MFKKITEDFVYRFETNLAGIHAIYVSAICNKKNSLRVEIDGLALKGILPKTKNQYFNIPPAWNGNALKGGAETIVFVIELAKGNHELKFISKGEAEIIPEPKIILLDKGGLVTLFQDIQSEEKNCQPWLAVALINLPLNIIDVSVSCKKKIIDSDDVKIIIDGQIQKNKKAIWRGKNWFWQGRQMNGRIEINRFNQNLPVGIHYVELWADRTPVLRSFDILINSKVATKRVPTTKNPEWTGNFLDDPEEIILARLIFGEANNQSREAKEWVGWSVVNRKKAKSWWPDTIHGVILQEGQYDPFKRDDDNFLKIINPLGYKNVGESDKISWYECCEIAKVIISGNNINPTEATHFNGFRNSEGRDWYEKNIVPKGKFLRKVDDTYFYWSPN
ncbi:MAG: hypothetical protein A3J93_00985 [Candidatus Magasanikbacteria bacterium RIFOXYC2_FULL_42_28]|uniref:Cell wall hydrolase SleB domain-containing protein n=1 Tax=Candidatus Magasanikbacteria bacterium RIFOXYC2_FULL_42_28 TaxID=1798704 RepID=A0A1F6NYC6_9BACT|nr:MAG: hypothetical protein A3J93_00985 [Candidatus Magasanikbacteria bacterium RIFOXYC2_FULL_42_28]